MSEVSLKSIKGSGDMERTQHSRVIPLTLPCELDLKSCALHTVLLKGTYE